MWLYESILVIWTSSPTPAGCPTAAALERRLLSGTGPVESSTDLSASDRISTGPDESQSRMASSPVV
jgi:hypothetical protein